MKYLIVNADDYGLDECINQAVILAYRQGIVTSTTILANGDAFLPGIEGLRDNSGLGVGVHLTLVNGNPLSRPEEIPTLLNGEGRFFSSYQEFIPHFLSGKIKLKEIRTEWAKQISRVRAQGIEITHLDSHQHLHVFPGINKVTAELAREFCISKIRLPREKMTFLGGETPSNGRMVARNVLSGVSMLSKRYFSYQGLTFPDHFYGMLWGGHLSQHRLETIIRNLPEGTSEIMTHPGLSTEALKQKFFWRYHWDEEFVALTSIRIKTIIAQKQIRLIHYDSL